MIHLIALPIILVAATLIIIGKFMKFKLLIRIFRLVLILALAFFIYEYIKIYGFTLNGILS